MVIRLDDLLHDNRAVDRCLACAWIFPDAGCGRGGALPAKPADDHVKHRREKDAKYGHAQHATEYRDP